MSYDDNFLPGDAEKIDRATLEQRARDTYRRVQSIPPDWQITAAIELMLNGRWGGCGHCPHDPGGLRRPDLCKYTERYDHDIR